MTDGNREYNAENYRVSAFYDLAKTAVIRLAFAQSKELAPHGCTAVAPTPGWMRSEMMLDNYQVTEATWRAAAATAGTVGRLATLIRDSSTAGIEPGVSPDSS